MRFQFSKALYAYLFVVISSSSEPLFVLILSPGVIIPPINVQFVSDVVKLHCREACSYLFHPAFNIVIRDLPIQHRNQCWNWTLLQAFVGQSIIYFSSVRLAVPLYIPQSRYISVLFYVRVSVNMLNCFQQFLKTSQWTIKSCQTQEEIKLCGIILSPQERILSLYRKIA